MTANLANSALGALPGPQEVIYPSPSGIRDRPVSLECNPFGSTTSLIHLPALFRCVRPHPKNPRLLITDMELKIATLNRLKYSSRCHLGEALFLFWETEFDRVIDGEIFPREFRDMSDDELAPHCERVLDAVRSFMNDPGMGLQFDPSWKPVQTKRRIRTMCFWSKVLNHLGYLVLVERLRKIFLNHGLLDVLVECLEGYSVGRFGDKGPIRRRRAFRLRNTRNMDILWNFLILLYHLLLIREDEVDRILMDENGPFRRKIGVVLFRLIRFDMNMLVLPAAESQSGLLAHFYGIMSFGLRCALEMSRRRDEFDFKQFFDADEEFSTTTENLPSLLDIVFPTYISVGRLSRWPVLELLTAVNSKSSRARIPTLSTPNLLRIMRVVLDTLSKCMLQDETLLEEDCQLNLVLQFFWMGCSDLGDAQKTWSFAGGDSLMDQLFRISDFVGDLSNRVGYMFLNTLQLIGSVALHFPGEGGSSIREELLNHPSFPNLLSYSRGSFGEMDGFWKIHLGFLKMERSGSELRKRYVIEHLPRILQHARRSMGLFGAQGERHEKNRLCRSMFHVLSLLILFVDDPRDRLDRCTRRLRDFLFQSSPSPPSCETLLARRMIELVVLIPPHIIESLCSFLCSMLDIFPTETKLAFEFPEPIWSRVLEVLEGITTTHCTFLKKRLEHYFCFAPADFDTILFEDVDGQPLLIDKNLRKKDCAFCGRRQRTMKRCSRCHAVYYCGRSCQVKHWRQEHKKNCRLD